jgi:uncharacterized damage-inducible protein DinB
MTEIEHLLDQFKRAHEDQAWHGPSLFPVLDGIAAEQAVAKPIPAAHSIWELVAHIITWEEVAFRRLQGDNYVPTDEWDFPKVYDPSEEQWQKTIKNLKDTYARLSEVIANFPESKLDEITQGRKTSNYFLIQGVIQHAAYHAGQIAILKKNN